MDLEGYPRAGDISAGAGKSGQIFTVMLIAYSTTLINNKTTILYPMLSPKNFVHPLNFFLAGYVIPPQSIRADHRQRLQPLGSYLP